MFLVEEVELLAELYVQNIDQYHSKFKTGSKLSKSTQDKLAQEWAISLSELGFAPRTAGQVKQKILDMKKKARKYLSDERREMTKTGGGKCPKKPAPNWLVALCSAMEKDGTGHGISGAAVARDPLVQIQPRARREPEARVQPHSQPEQISQSEAGSLPEPTNENSDDSRSAPPNGESRRGNSSASSAVRMGRSVPRLRTVIRSRRSEVEELRIRMLQKECELVTFRLEAEKKRLNAEQAREDYYNLKIRRMSDDVT
ncbi:hypothetical protein ANCCAN_24866 [Ancylostoma caninum]|uniref:Uncharacterized protein n=1 Tax=Ancylostoma caninum TaxID=29170 RepID=A0A368FGS0_ANCCA|nr:hypothetical protein ANCCAN_24866 [Ancylostoma caninum]